MKRLLPLNRKTISRGEVGRVFKENLATGSTNPFDDIKQEFFYAFAKLRFINLTSHQL